LKGFKKDGKFRPTGKKSNSALKKSDIKPRKRNDIFSGSSPEGIPKPQQVMPTEAQSQPPLQNINIPEPPKHEKGKPVLPQEGIAKKGLKGLISGAKKLNEQGKKYDKKRAEEEARRIQLEESINDSMDKILNDKNSTNEQKFRLLQRFAMKVEDSLTPYQLDFINRSLKTLEAESINPQTFLGASQPNQKNTSTNRNQIKSGTRGILGTTNQPVTMASGQRLVPSREDIAINLASSQNPRVNPFGVTPTPSTTTTTTTSTPSGQPDNQGAEINAILGR